MTTIEINQIVTGHIDNRLAGRTEFTGEVIDIYQSNGQTVAAVSCDDGHVRHARPESLHPANESPEWAGTHSNPFYLHRFDNDLKARCNRRIQSRDRATQAGQLVGHDELRTRREIETSEHGHLYTFCAKCKAL